MSKTRKLAVMLLKGGVGKTTTAVTLAHGLSLTEHSVLLVDCDPQNHAALFLGAQREKGLDSCLTNKKKDCQEFIIEARPGLDILPAGENLAVAVHEISLRTYAPERALMDTLKPVAGKYDFVILDTAPGWDAFAVNCLAYAEELICPMLMEVAAVESLNNLRSRMEPVAQDRPQLRVTTVLPTFYDGRVREHAGILGQLREHAPELVADPVHRTIRFAEANGRGQTILEYMPHSKAAEEYRLLVQRTASQEG